MVKRLPMWVLCICLMLVIFTACNGEETPMNSAIDEPSDLNGNTSMSESDGKDEPAEDSVKGIDEEAEIFIYSVHGTTNEAFDELWGSRLEEQFPHLTVEFLQSSTGNTIKDLVARKQFPDVMRTAFNELYEDYIDLGLAYDMTDLVEKYDFDTSVFVPALMTRIINEAPNGELYGVPITGSTNVMAMFYNKGIFERFGMEYPTDDMTWDELYEVVKQIGRTEDGVTYRGFTELTPNVLRYNQLGLPFLDPNENKIYDMDQWVPVFNNLLRFYELENNQFAEALTDHYYDFYRKLNVAITLTNYGNYRQFPEELDWDVMAMPKFEGIPPNNGGLGAAYWSITEQARDKDLAFQVIEYLSSQEVQMANAKIGYVPSIVDDEVYKSFGEDDPLLDGKNVNGFFAYEYAPAPARRDPNLVAFNEGDQANIFRDILVKVAQGTTDINTAIREATEIFEQKFNEAAGSQ